MEKETERETTKNVHHRVRGVPLRSQSSSDDVCLGNFNFFFPSFFGLPLAARSLRSHVDIICLFVCAFLLFFSIWLIIVSKSTLERHLWPIITIVNGEMCTKWMCVCLVRSEHGVCVGIAFI